MTTKSAENIAEIVRRRLGAEASEALRFQPLVEPALLLLARDIATDRRRRHLLLTDPATVTVALDGDGVADLGPLVADAATFEVLLDRLEFGSIYHPDSPNPLILVDKTRGRAEGNYDNLHQYCWLEGTKLHTKGADGPLTGGPLGLAVPYRPTLAQLSEQLVEPLVEKVIEQAAENKADYEREGDDEG